MGFLRFIAALAAGTAAALAQPVTFVENPFPTVAGETFRGAAFEAGAPGEPSHLFTWGDRVLAWTIPDGRAAVVVQGAGDYGRGGCMADVNGDGTSDPIIQERPASETATGLLVWFASPDWERHIIDTGDDFPGCLPARIEGRAGILLLNERRQLRFYTIPDDPSARWPHEDLASTESDQGGLLVADVDADGRDDILFGNHWLRAPARAGLPWRSFAINAWHERPRSTMARIVRLQSAGGDRFVIAQTEHANARLAVYDPPEERTDLWTETRLGGLLRLSHPRALVAADFDGDGDDDLLAGEDRGAGSRLLLFEASGEGLQPTVAGTTDGLIGLWTADIDPDGVPDVVGVGPGTVTWWRTQPRR